MDLLKTWHAWLLSDQVLRTCICIIRTFRLTFFLRNYCPFSLFHQEVCTEQNSWNLSGIILKTTNMYINAFLLPYKIHILVRHSSESLLKELFTTFWLRIFNHNVCMWNFYILYGIFYMLAFYHVHIHISIWKFDWNIFIGVIALFDPPLPSLHFK